MNNLINHLSSVSNSIKKSSIFGAMELRDGYFVSIKINGIKREINRFESKNYSHKDYQNEIKNFDLDDFIKENIKREMECLMPIEKDINDYKIGIKNRYWSLEKSFCFSKEFDKPVWRLTYNDKPGINNLSLEELMAIREMLNNTKNRIIKRCETYWKKYGKDKIKWCFYISDID